MLKKNLIIAIILVLIVSSISLIVIFNNKEVKQINKETLFYKEKATNLSVKEFDKNNKLTKKIIAKSFTTFDEKEDIIEKPIVQNFANNNSQIKADFAKIIVDDNLEFSGNVEILNDNKSSYKLKTESIIAYEDLIYSTKKVEYYLEKDKITSDGIKIWNKRKEVQLLGNNELLFANGNKVISSNIEIAQKNNLNYLSSIKSTKFISKNSIANSNNGFAVYDGTTYLLGESNLQQNDANIIAANLQIKDNIYQAKKTKYTKENTTINASNLYFDDNSELVELSGNVKGFYQADELIEIYAQKAIIDKKTGITQYSDDVSFQHKNMLLKAENLKIIKNANNDYQVLALGDKNNLASFVKNDSEITSSAKRIVYFSQEDLIHLEKNATLSKNGADFAGDKISYDAKNDKVLMSGEADNRVKLKIKL
jgi:lipopolysaccharide transport protein LptA/LPS export ABC transporter protein LptC